MLKINIVPHKALNQFLLNEIIRIKSFAWPYSYEMQMKWIYSNLKDSDIHILLTEEEYPKAYLNLITIKLEINKRIYEGLGIGNVCSSEKGKGWGVELIRKTNDFIKNENKIGLLFCKPNLEQFYSKNNWETVDKNNLKLEFDNNNIVTMVFNCIQTNEHISYLGKSF